MSILLFILIIFCKNKKEVPIQTPEAYPIPVSTKMMAITGEVFCNHVCWSHNGNASFSYTFKGVQFIIYGRHKQSSKFNLIFDDENLGEIIETQNDKKEADLLYVSKVYEYNYHTILAEGQHGQYFEIFKFAFWPEIKVKRLNISDMSNIVNFNEGFSKSDLSSYEKNQFFEIDAYKFWIYGTLNGTNCPHEDYKLLFESTETTNLTHSILYLINDNANPVLLNCVYYQYDHFEQINNSNKFFEQIYFTNTEAGQNNYIYMTLIRFALSAVALFIFIFKIKKKFLQENTFIIVIIGEHAKKPSDSFTEKNVYKYGNYCFSSYALLIKRLATKYLGLNEQHVLIFGEGKMEDNNIATLISENRIFVQLTADEIYETKSLNSELDFIPFQNVDDLLFKIYTFLNCSNCPKPNIILYMLDHGDKHCFGELKFLELYLRLMNFPHSSLRIYNDSCKSNSMILKIKNYFAISEIIKSFTPEITQNELLFLASVAETIYPNGGIDQWDAINSLDNRYFNYISKNDGNDYFNDFLSFIKGEIKQNQLYNKYRFAFSKEDIDTLILIVKCYMTQYSIPGNYKIIHCIFEKGIRVVKTILRKCNITNKTFNLAINDLLENKPNFAYELYKQHPNHSIITSSHESGFSPSFGSLRINQQNKFVPGSPAMGAYIIESLMNRSLNKNSINNIKKMVYGNHEGFMMEYAVQNSGPKKKKWVRLNINYWESNSNSIEKILLYQDVKMKVNIEDIMKSIGFKLAMKCNIQFNERNVCITKKMQPIYKSLKEQNVIGLRLVPLNENHDFNQGYDEYDNYYDDYSGDGNDTHHQNTLSTSKSYNNNTPNSPSFESLFKNDNYDVIISQSYINKVIQEVKKSDWMIFPTTVVEVFKHELNKLIKDEKFVEKYSSLNQKTIINTTIDRVELLLHKWIRHFFPVYTIEYQIDGFVQFFHDFINKYQIQEEDARDIFNKCMNVADQVASQLSHSINTPTYYAGRLNNLENNI